MTWTQHISYESLEKINLSLRSFETGNLSADNFKNYSNSMGRHLSPGYGYVILVSGYPVLTAVNWSQHWCAPKLQARKCENKHWFPCGEHGRSFVRCTVTWLPNFPGWVDFLIYGAPHTRRALHRAWSSPTMFVDSPDVQKVRGLWNEIDSQASTCLFMRNLIYFVTCDFWTNRKV